LTKPTSPQNYRSAISSKSAQPKSLKNRPNNQLRIIGGKWRGRRLQFPSVDGLRPTGDRIRETLFNWLAPFIHDSLCLDLFAGSGALGLEALSRGAGHSVLIEMNPHAATRLKQHLQTLQADAELIKTDALSWLRTANKATYGSFDLVFLDPPFSQSLWDKSVSLLIDSGILAPQAFIYVETPVGTSLTVIPSNWELWREKITGAVAYRLFKAP
jgi:16S rRNA (guanine966-N2)-methyltransferase